MNLDFARRYVRQTALPEIGEAGQEKLRAAKVLVIGAGGLGSPLITYLAAGGIGHLGVIDDDRVELSNLPRQIIHETGDIGRLKVESAADRIAELNPACQITRYPFALDATNAAEIITGSSPLAGEVRRGGEILSTELNGIPPSPTLPARGREYSGYDVVADGSDRFETRFLVNRICVAARIPLVSAAVSGWDGQLLTIAPHLAPESGCYQCIVHPQAADERTCDLGILAPFAGEIGCAQALEVMRALLGFPAWLSHLALFHGRDGTHRRLARTRDPECPACK